MTCRQLHRRLAQVAITVLALVPVCALAATAGEAEDDPSAAVEKTPPPDPTPANTAPTKETAAPTGTKPRRAPVLVTEEPPAEFRGPDITLIASEERMVYEYRQNGQLRMIKVVPKLGKPYYLAPFDRTRGFGDLEQARTLVAEWVLWEF